MYELCRFCKLEKTLVKYLINTIGKSCFNHIEILKKLLSIVKKSMEELINLMVYTIKIFIFEIKKAKYPGKREKQFKIGKKIIELSL